jgi:hypothetical protein
MEHTMHPTIHTQPLTVENIATALAIVSNPGSFHDDMESRLAAWMALKARAGKPIPLADQCRVERYQRHFCMPAAPARPRQMIVPEAPLYDGLVAS